ncbi:MAG: hypothetical protein II453_13685 [Alphaproteobacteria bacterium]|nr:hypothetical protein [Alphaproteobacteria bacterium]
MFDWLKNKLFKDDNVIVVNKGEMFKRWLDRNREILTGKIQEDTFLRVLVKTGWYYKQVEDIRCYANNIDYIDSEYTRLHIRMVTCVKQDGYSYPFWELRVYLDKE